MEYVENKEEEKEQISGIFKDIAKYSPSKIIGTVGNAIVIPIYTRLLPPEQYGIYSLSIAFLSFLCIIFSDWVGLSGLRFFRKHQLSDDLSKYLSTLVSILVMNVILMFVLCYFFQGQMLSFFKIDPKYFYGVLFLIIPVAVRALLFQLLRAQLKSSSYTFTTILNQFLTIGLSIYFIKYFNMGALAMLLAMGISISLIDILLIYQSKIYLYFRKPKLQWSVILPIILYGIPLAATSLSAWTINQSNKFIMNSIKTFTEVAYVGVGYSATQPILMTLFAIITVAAIPRILRMYEAKIDVRPIISKFSGYYMLTAIPLVTIMALYPDAVINLLANKKFHEAYILIPYFAFGTFFMGLADYTTLQYHLANKTYIEFIIKLASGLTNVALTIFLIPKVGLLGVGLATFIGNLLYLILSLIIKLPGLSMKFPIRAMINLGLAFMPVLGLYKLMQTTSIHVKVSIQMSLLLLVFYLMYFAFLKISRKIKPEKV